ncbi:papilin [Nephila pilipes]|uniref:Papilin n=1 Tax=Nephila pilipes TaxID=299642 RepID=A0A8X6T3S5_NEPPI|nr:papilin [Nephila pilipes]
MTKLLWLSILAAVALRGHASPLEEESNRLENIANLGQYDPKYGCLSDGKYPNYEDCNTFIQCSKRVKTVMLCPNDLHFNERTKKCEKPCDARCNITLLEDYCFLPNVTGNCRAGFYNYFFNKFTGKCEKFLYGGCGGNKNNFQKKEECEEKCSKKDPEPEFKCLTDELYRNPKNCSTYIQCSNGIAHIMPCPKDLHYNEEKKQCDYKCDAYCNKTLSCECKWSTCGLNDVCFLPKVIGNCRALIPKYFFNKRTGKCEEFKYGGCDGNDNNFNTKEECEKKCSKHEDSEGEFKCLTDELYRNPKNCSTYIQCSNGIAHIMPCPKDLHYNEEKKECDYKCDAYCNKTLCLDDKCFLPKKTGPCKASIKRFFFNKRNGKCEEFTYGGCRGNKNSFETKEECEKKCSHTHNSEDSEPEFKCIVDELYRNPKNCSTYIQCSNGIAHIMPCPKDLHYNEEKKQCDYKCDAYCNKTLCLDNVCFLPKVIGPCRARIPRYFFNKRTGKCETFNYGGCRGNDNNFNSKEKCEKRCSKHADDDFEDSEAEFRCIADGLYPNPRNCSTFIQCSNGIRHIMHCPASLQYNAEKKECDYKCDAYCNKTLCLNDVCFLPKETGPCLAYIPRYFFDKRTGKCEKFTYGGCLGNENNFITKEACEKNCSHTHNSEDSEVEFKCIKDGLYTNPDDCSTFIQCSNGIVNIMPCPKGLHYNEEKQQCDEQCKAYCDKTLSCRCKWPTCGLVDVCFLPKVVGNCQALIPKYFFNKRTGKCEEFKYGGCDGNGNNFETKEKCERICSKHPEPEFKCTVDGLFPNPENCSTFIQCSNTIKHIMPCPKGLHYNEKKKQCDEECKAYCDKTLCLEDVCFLPEVVGNCEALIPRYFFNKRTGQCEKFKYGGCGGNRNNFGTKEECEKNCSTHSSEKTEPEFKCLADGLYPNPKSCSSFIQCSNGIKNIMPCPENLHYNEEKKVCDYKCKAYCDKTLSCECKWPTCGQDDVCFLPKKVGRCTALIPKYFFDKRTGKCEKFHYGGCDKNGNNFETKTECEEKCCSNSKSESEEASALPFCGLPPEIGRCKRFETRYYYNPSKKQCEEFVYGGCEGNRNNFKTKEDCSKFCRPLQSSDSASEIEDPSDCNLPRDKGPCKGYLMRYYYDKTEKSCKKFIYGGCQGNENNFGSIAECIKKCVAASSDPEDIEVTLNPDEFLNSEEDDRETINPGELFHSEEDSKATLNPDELFHNEEDADFEMGPDEPDCSKSVDCLCGLPTCKQEPHMRKCHREGEYVRWPKGNTCNTYVKCSTKSILTCPQGLHFDDLTRRCVDPCRARCDKTNNQLAYRCGWPEYKERSEKDSPLSSEEDFRCPRDGRFPHPHDCKSYIKCSDGLKERITCPSGLHFNEKTESCDSPCDARCDLSLAIPCKWPMDSVKCINFFFIQAQTVDANAVGDCDSFICDNHCRPDKGSCRNGFCVCQR